jgi:hypothetical protein
MQSPSIVPIGAVFVPSSADLDLERRIEAVKANDSAPLLKLTELVSKRRPEYVAWLEQQKLKRILEGS